MMNKDAQVREERPGDAAAVRLVNERAFGQPEEAGIVDRLRERCPDRLSLVAELEGRVVGYLLFNPVALEGDGRAIRGMGLAPMAVLPECQRQGVGRASGRSSSRPASPCCAIAAAPSSSSSAIRSTTPGSGSSRPRGAASGVPGKASRTTPSWPSSSTRTP